MNHMTVNKVIVLTEEGDDVPFRVEHDEDELVVIVNLDDLEEQAFTRGYITGERDGLGVAADD